MELSSIYAGQRVRILPDAIGTRGNEIGTVISISPYGQLCVNVRFSDGIVEAYDPDELEEAVWLFI